jgi:hypothetical protein
MMVWVAVSWYSSTLHGPIIGREYVNRLGNQVQPMIQTLFPNSDAVFQADSAPLHTAGTVQSPASSTAITMTGLERH